MCMASRIKNQRLKCGYTQEELADKLGLQKSAIAKYENGRVENIKRSTIEKMAEILECSPAYLMGWNKNQQSSTFIMEQEYKTNNITPSEKEHIEKYRKLNERGKENVCNIIEIELSCLNENNPIKQDMQRLAKYYELISKFVNNQSSELLNAAHDRTDIEVTDDMKEHDEKFFDED